MRHGISRTRGFVQQGQFTEKIGFFQFGQRERAVIQRIQLDMSPALLNDMHTDAGLILIENGFSFLVFPYLRITGNGRQFLAIQRLNNKPALKAIDNGPGRFVPLFKDVTPETVTHTSVCPIAGIKRCSGN